jgi:hypothetical protein
MIEAGSELAAFERLAQAQFEDRQRAIADLAVLIAGHG